jgi:acetyltransferase-like isoleucine patch superfamily enzyme
VTRSDESTRILVRMRIGKSRLIEGFCLLRMRVQCSLWKVSLGKRALFHGLPIVHRSPESTLTIGDDCSFLSIPRSNYAGINRPCYLVTLKPGAVLHLGDGCGLSGTVISAALSITLGKGVLCGANSTIVDTDFHHVDPTRRADHIDVPAAPVVIEDNVWLGMGCTVLKGVTIGRDSVIAAGSVVVGNIPARVIAGGIPAQVLRSLDAPDLRRE